MTDKPTQTLGEAPMTAAQRSTLQTLSEQAGQAFDAHLTQAQAARRIEVLRASIGASGRAADVDSEEGPLEALGRAVGETVLGSDPEADDARVRRG